MAQKRQDDQYEDALGSIYDFIFKNNSEPNRGMRPVRPSGVSGMDDMTRALSELAAQPFTYLPDAALDNVNQNFMGGTFMELELDKDGEKIKIGPNSIVAAMKDPNKFVDKVFDAQKEENKWKRYATGASYLDHAIATGIGLKSGMKIGDAWNFGAAARGTYKADKGLSTDFGIRRAHQDITASNASMEANIDLAKSRARAEGLDVNSDEFGSRVYELAKTQKDQMKKDEVALKKAMNSNAKLRQFGFLGGNNTRDPNYEANLDQMLGEVKSDLMRQIGDETRANALVEQLRGEVARNENYRGGVTGYRMMYSRNQQLQAQLASNQAEMEKHLMAGNMAYTWERMHGGNEKYSDIRGFEDVEAEFSKDIAAAEARIENPSVSEAEKEALRGFLKEMKESENRVNAVGDKIRASHNGVQEYWRPQNFSNNNPASADRKAQREMTKELLGAEKAKLQIQIKLAPDEFEKRRLMMRLAGIESGVEKMAGKSSRWNFQGIVNSQVGSYRAMQGLTSAGTFGALLSGAAWYKDFKGTPGSLGDSVIQRKGKDKDGNVVFGPHKDSEDSAYTSKIILPRDDITSPFGKNANSIIARTTHFYYLTPGSLLKTLTFNGEGFSYIAEMRQRTIQRSFYADHGDHLTSFIQANPSLFTDRDSLKGLFVDGVVDNDMLARNYLEIMDILGENENLLSPQLAKILKQANRKYASLARFAKAGDWMNRNIANKVAPKKVIKNLLARKRVAAFMARMPKGQTLTRVLGGDLALKTAIRGGVHSLAAAAGIATGGIGAIVVEIIAFVGTEIAYRLAKPILKISLFAILGICGIIGFVFYYISDAAFNVGGGDVAYANFTPGTQYYCGGENYSGPAVDPYSTGFAPGSTIPPGGPPGTSVPGSPGNTPPPGTTIPAATGNIPTDAQCPLSAGFRCTQGPNGHWSHASMASAAIDVYAGTWEAPTDGVVTFSNTSNDCEWDSGKDRGGEMWFTDSEGNEYRLLHVSPNIKAGPVNAGDTVATIQTNLPTSACWTGAHMHLDTKTNGRWTDSMDVYRQLGCNIPSCPE